MRHLLVAVVLLLTIVTANAQHTTWTVKMKGYLFTMREDIVYFQPCSQEHSTSFLEALDSTLIKLSFAFQEQRTLQEYCMGIGDSILIDIYEDGKKWDMHGERYYINYFYCEVEVMLFVFDWGGIKRDKSDYKFSCNSKFYSLSGLSVMNHTLKIIPSQKRDLKRLIVNYQTSGRRMPDWLYELAYPGKKQKQLPPSNRTYE